MAAARINPSCCEVFPTYLWHAPLRSQAYSMSEVLATKEGRPASGAPFLFPTWQGRLHAAHLRDAASDAVAGVAAGLRGQVVFTGVDHNGVLREVARQAAQLRAAVLQI